MDTIEGKEMVPARYRDFAAGAVPALEIEAWLQAAGFRNVRVAIKPASRDLVASWAPGRGIENDVASAIIEARKPDPTSDAACCATSCCP